MSVTTRTITVRVDGDATKANKAMSSVGKSAGGLGSKIAKIGGIIAAAFSVQQIVQFGKESVRAMMEDQKSAAILARTLKNVTKARKDDIASVEYFIRKTEEATGVADDDLRPAFARLIRSTKDITKAQRLMNVALDMSAATGKPLSGIVNALGRAADGSLSGLTRMGVTIDKATLKSKDFSKVLPQLEKTFGGSMSEQANTFAGRVERIKRAFENMKEDIGYALLPKLEDLAEWMTGKGIKAIRTFLDVLLGNDTKAERDPSARADDFRASVDPLQASAAGLAEAIKKLNEELGKLFGSFTEGTSSGSGLVAFVDLLTTMVNLVEKLASGIGAVSKALQWTGDKASDGGWFSKLLGAINILTGADPQTGFNQWSGIPNPRTNPNGGRAIGGTVSGGRPMLVGERGPEIFTPSASGYITANNRLGMGGGGGVNVTVNVQGSVIRERDLAVSVRDEIAQLMRRRGLNPAILGV